MRSFLLMFGLLSFLMLFFGALAFDQTEPSSSELLPKLGSDRPAWYALPDSYDPATPIPLSIALHGQKLRAEITVQPTPIRQPL